MLLRTYRFISLVILFSFENYRTWTWQNEFRFGPGELKSLFGVVFLSSNDSGVLSPKSPLASCEICWGACFHMRAVNMMERWVLALR